MKSLTPATLLLSLCFLRLAASASTPWDAYPAEASFGLSGQTHTVSAEFPIQAGGVRAFQQTGDQLTPVSVEHTVPEEAKNTVVFQLLQVARSVRWIVLLPSADASGGSLHTIAILPADSLPNLRNFTKRHSVYLDNEKLAAVAHELDAAEIAWQPIRRINRTPSAGSLVIVEPKHSKLEDWKKSETAFTILVVELSAPSVDKKAFTASSPESNVSSVILTLPLPSDPSATALLHLALDYVAADTNQPPQRPGL